MFLIRQKVRSKKRQDIKKSVECLEIGRGDRVLVNSSFKSMGYVEGGAESVIAGFLDVIGGVVLKVLAIGNSFSIDATRYLHKIAKADNCQMKVVVLAIGGSSLRDHYINALEDNKVYGLYFNGSETGFLLSIKEALISDEWDWVIIQQVSCKSTDYCTFQPYLQFMAEYIRKYSPESKIYLQQTWAYEDGSQRLCEQMKYMNAETMLADVKKAYQLAAEAFHADGIIPSGEVMYEMVRRGIKKVHRDTSHASLGLGRYALGLAWYATLTSHNIMTNTFSELDEETSVEEMNTAKECVRDILNIF